MNLFLSTMKHIKVFLYLQLVEQGVTSDSNEVKMANTFYGF